LAAATGATFFGTRMPTNPGDIDPGGDLPITDSAARQIAGGFNLAVSDVIVDAHEVSSWHGPTDDLLQLLEHRHAFRASTALSYLMSLRIALQRKTNQGKSD